MAVPRGSERVVVATMGAVGSVAVGAAVWMAAVQEVVVVEGTFSGAVGLATVATESAVEGSATVVAGSARGDIDFLAYVGCWRTWIGERNQSVNGMPMWAVFRTARRFHSWRRKYCN